MVRPESLAYVGETKDEFWASGFEYKLLERTEATM